MAEIGRTVSASLDINEVYETLGEEIHKLIPFHRMSLSLVNHESGTMSPTWVVGTDVPGRRQGDDFPLAGASSGEVVRTKSPIMLEAETEADLEHRFPLLLSSFRAGLRSFMAVPLFSRDAVIGILRVGSKDRGAYTQWNLELLGRIGTQIAGAVANSQLYAERVQAEEALRSSEEQTRLIVETAYDAFISMDAEGLVTAWNTQAESIFGWSKVEAIGQNLASLVMPARYRERHQRDLEHFLRTWEGPVLNQRIELEVQHRDGHEFPVELTVSPLKTGETYIFNAFVHDITERRQAEEQTRASLAEKEVLLKEINHRVKNNLQIISSLLNLQSRDIQDERALRSFQVSQDRIKAMALVHEKLYQSEDLARIDFGEYIKSLATDLGSTYGFGLRHIDLKIDVEDILLGVDTAIPCGVIVNELVANSLKHAFPGDRPGEIAISFREVDGQYTMVFKDEGVGLPEDLDISHPSSLGLTIVNALTGQLGGAIDLGRNGGCEIILTFPAK